MKLVLLLSAALLVTVQLSGGVSDGGFPEPYAEGEVTRSNLSIPPGETVVIGGDHQGGLIVQARNTGPAVVTITSKGDTVGARKVHPRDFNEATYAPGQAALLVNNSEKRTARLKVTITAPPAQTLAMR